MRVRHRRDVGGSLACVTLLLAPAGVGTEWATPIEPAWGGAAESGLHRLLRDIVHEGRERMPRAGGRARDGARGGPQGRVGALVTSDRCGTNSTS